MLTYRPWPALPLPVVGYNVEVLDNPGGPEVEVLCGGGPLGALGVQSLPALGLGDPAVDLGSPVAHQGTFAAFALEFLYREHPGSEGLEVWDHCHPVPEILQSPVV